jgi:hypothetical protein
MSDVFPNDASVSAERRMDEVCDRFEKAWIAGRKPRIEDFLQQVAAPDRSALIPELVQLDLEYRRRAGEAPRHEDYQLRFPGMQLAPFSEPPTTDDDIITPGPSPTNPETSIAPTEAVDSHLRYLPLRFHARGGLGEVFVARDSARSRSNGSRPSTPIILIAAAVS